MLILTKLPMIAGITLLMGCAGCSRQPSQSPADSARLDMFTPLPDMPLAADRTVTEAKIVLGRMLYHDPRLSKDQKISCNSCHDLANYGVDGQPTSDGYKSQRGNRNSPTVYNAAAQFVQFWDGRARDVEAQAKGPVLNPVEMAMPSDRAVVAVLKSMPGYVAAFQKAFPGEADPVNFDNMAMAIGAFERGLLTPSRWDKFLKGDGAALSAEEKAGFNKFTDAGCQTCHQGMLLGGNLYQRLGVAKSYPDAADPGRFNVTHNDADRMLFKVPSLRNVDKTGPYFHNGKVGTLREAVLQMADYQLGKELKAADVDYIVLFLKTLTGDLPGDYIKAPDLPKSTDQTPKAVTD